VSERGACSGVSRQSALLSLHVRRASALGLEGRADEVPQRVDQSRPLADFRCRKQSSRWGHGQANSHSRRERSTAVAGRGRLPGSCPSHARRASRCRATSRGTCKAKAQAQEARLN